METKTKRNLALWAIGLLIILNLSSLGTIWFHRYQFKKANKHEHRESRFEGRRGQMSQRMHRVPRFIDGSMELSEQQKEVIDTIWNHFNTKRRVLEDSMNKNRVRMFDIMMEESLDSGMYEELSQSQSILFRELNDTMLEMNRTLRDNLTEEQRQIMTQKMKEMRQRRPQERRQRMRK